MAISICGGGVIVSTFYNEDCMEGMKRYPDKFFDLAIVDPPYGIDLANMNMGAGKGKRASKIQNRQWKPKEWDKEQPSEEYFTELFRVSQNQIIWGGNYFPLAPTRCFIVWDKGEGMYGRSFAECEFAWASFDKSARIYKHTPVDKSRFHPTQKPVALYKWLLQNYAKQGDKILDTHVGSASSLIACHRLGFDYVGFEIDPDYYKAACERLAKVQAQQTIFDLPTEQIEKQTLFDVCK